jgi:enoyl-CoA hydratase
VIAKQALNLIEPTDPSAHYRIEQGFTLEMYMHEDSQKARDAFAGGKGTATF